MDENGNPPSTSSNNGNSSVSFTARQLKPLSIYRHNPAFHSQHVSVNQLDEIPPLSPTSLQPNTPLKSSSHTTEQENSDRMLPAKVRRKKKVCYSINYLLIQFEQNLTDIITQNFLRLCTIDLNLPPFLFKLMRPFYAVGTDT